jgi:hypothetical protein
VEAAWEELRALTGAGHRTPPPPFDAGARLRRLATALPEGLSDRDRWAARIAALTGDSARIEESLVALDEELLRDSETRLSAAERSALESGRDDLLARLGARLPAEEVNVAIDRLWRQQLRRHCGLPVLSLFSPEAAPPEVDTPPSG